MGGISRRVWLQQESEPWKWPTVLREAPSPSSRPGSKEVLGQVQGQIAPIGSWSHLCTQDLSDLCFLGGTVVKNPSATAGNARDPGSIPRFGRYPGKGKWQPTQVFLPGEFHGQGSLVGYSSWGRRVRHDWACTHMSLSARKHSDPGSWSPGRSPQAAHSEPTVRDQWMERPGHWVKTNRGHHMADLSAHSSPSSPAVHNWGLWTKKDASYMSWKGTLICDTRVLRVEKGVTLMTGRTCP